MQSRGIPPSLSFEASRPREGLLNAMKDRQCWLLGSNDYYFERAGPVTSPHLILLQLQGTTSPD